MLLHGPKAGKSGAASNDVHFGMLRHQSRWRCFPSPGYSRSESVHIQASRLLRDADLCRDSDRRVEAATGLVDKAANAPAWLNEQTLELGLRSSFV
jgi:hypothetical protein